MKRVATWIILTMAAAALLLAMLPSMPAQATAYKSSWVLYKIKFTAGSNVVSVEMNYDLTGDGDFGNELYQQGLLPADYFKITKVTDADGNQIAASWDAEGRVWRVSAEGEVTVDYDINLESLKNQPEEAVGFGDSAFSPFMPHWDKDYCFMPSEYLLLNPFPLSNNEYRDYTASVDLPEGWGDWPSWNVEGDTEANATRGAVFAGETSSVEVQGEIPLTVIQPLGADPANLAAQQEFADKLAAQLKTANEAWGKPGIPSERLYVYLGGVAPDGIDNQRLLSIPFDPLYGCAFVPVGASENILSADFLLRAGDESMRELLWEMSVDPSALWFREGCIHYSNLRFAQRNQWISESDVFDQLGQDYALYVDSLARSGTSPAGAGDQVLQEPMASLLYGGGTIAVTSIDARLAAKGKSLDEFIAGLLQKKPEGSIPNQYLQDELKAYSGEDFSAFFKDYITGDKVIPASSFSQLKLSTETEANAGQNDIKPAPGFGSKWIMIIIAILIVFALPFLLEPYTLRPRGGSEPFDHDVEGKKKSGGRWWSWDEEEEEDEAKDLEDDAGGGEEEKAPGPEEGADDPEVESAEDATPLPPEL